MKTMKTLIAQLGIDEANEVRLLNRRARYAMTRDRTKFYASTPAPVAFGRKADGSAYIAHDVDADMLTLKLASDTACPYPERTRDYVTAWCRLNHLKA